MYPTAASGPVRLFTPYKRRRRNQGNSEASPVQTKQKKPVVVEEEPEPAVPGIVTKEEATWQTIGDGIDASNDYIDHTTHSK